MSILLFTLLRLIWVTSALIAYDCGSNSMNLTTLSLLEVGQCDIPTSQPVISNIDIQLLQLGDYSNLGVLQCKVEILRTIYHCGMHSHVSVVTNGLREYIHFVTKEECINMHLYKSWKFDYHGVITSLKLNGTISQPISLGGTTNIDGTCQGIQYGDEYGNWENVVVQGSIKISLWDYQAKNNLNSNTVILRSGYSCSFNEGNCIDPEDGNTFWEVVPTDSCHFNRYDVLYEGKGVKIQNNDTHTQPDLYTLTTQDTTFALVKRGSRNICGYTLINTEHPKLFIIENPIQMTFAHKKTIATSNLDIFAYINSKFIYVERHIRTQMTTLYQDVLTQKCKLEQDILRNALALAASTPDEFAYHLMKGPGYMAVIAGEVVHMIKCVPVDVKVRQTPECYQQLPILKGNESMFITPKSHMLLKTGTQIDCNPAIPTMYYINDRWYTLTPYPTATSDPTTIKPLTKPTWKYVNPNNLATSGIYTQEDLERLRDHIMFPAERPGLVNDMVRGMTGKTVANHQISIANFLTEDAMQKIVDNTWSRLWGWFTGFGTTSAGIIGIWISFKAIKFFLDTLLHGYALKKVYGWSIHILGAIWDSLTNLLLHMAKPAEEGTRSAISNPSTGNNEPDNSNRDGCQQNSNIHPGILLQTKPTEFDEIPRHTTTIPSPRCRDASTHASTNASTSKKVSRSVSFKIDSDEE